MLDIKSIILYWILLINFATTLSSPVPSKRDQDNNNNKILFDQRQEGKWNIRADLKNFVILIIPAETTASSTTPSVGGGLLNFFRKSPLKRSHLKHYHNQEKTAAAENNAAQETLHFIESKTAPYHVDISQTKSHLAKLHPETVPVVRNEEIVIANSPSIALLKAKDALDSHRTSRMQRAFVLSLPANEEFVLTQTEDQKKIVKKDVKKKIRENPKNTLKLIGAENEQCGPGLMRDSYGNCRVYKN